MIHPLAQEYPVGTVCQALGWPRSTYYYTPEEDDDAPLKAAIEQVIREWPTVRLQVEWVYLAVLMDVFTRSIRGWHVGRNLDHELTLIARQRALAQRRPEIHHADQGVQYAATAYVQTLQEAGGRISRAAVGEPTENGYAERLIRTLREEQINLSEYQDHPDAYRQIGRFLDEVYMHKRIHSSLGYLTPVEFESQWQSQLAQSECED